MKIFRTVLAFMASLFVFMACSKEDPNKPVVFTLSYNLVESNSMYGLTTKSILNTEVISAIKQCLPTSVQFVFRNSLGSSTVVTSGVETALPEGTYTVTASSNGGIVGTQISSTNYFTYQPYITFDTKLTIEKGISEYTVSGSYKSFAIAVDFDEILQATYSAGSSQSVISFKRFDNLGLIFCQGNYNDSPLSITLTPLNSNTHKETIVSFSTNSNTTKYTYAQMGYFYKIHPREKGASDPVIEIGFPDFQEGVVRDE